uniref:5'-deoxynucleotidase n=1 Tax=Hemiselmis tepida TaxID=464990 RepID=A0A7S0W8B4_9CRYP
MAAAGGEAAPSPAHVLEFLTICGKLKKTVRTGWKRSGVEPCESVADHSWRMGVLSMLLPPDVDRHHCIKMAIVHDLAEAIVGDISPHCGISDEEKERRERDAMGAIRQAAGDSPVGREIQGLWEEYEAGQSPEARAVKDLDKFEMIVQAEEYERETGVDLEQFFSSTRGKIKHPVMQGWEKELRAQRERRLGGGGGKT